MFDDGQCVFLVQNLLRGEELLDRALRVPNFTERDASDIICTLTKTVEYLHSQGVRQRDRTPMFMFGFVEAEQKEKEVVKDQAGCKQIPMTAVNTVLFCKPMCATVSFFGFRSYIET